MEFPKEYKDAGEWGSLYWTVDGGSIFAVLNGNLLHFDAGTARLLYGQGAPDNHGLNSLTPPPDGDLMLANTNLPATYVRGEKIGYKLLGRGLHAVNHRKQFWHPDAQRFVGSDSFGWKNDPAKARLLKLDP